MDEDALFAALGNNEITGERLDVFVDEMPTPDHSLIKHDDLAMALNISGTTIWSLRRMSLGGENTSIGLQEFTSVDNTQCGGNQSMMFAGTV
ncbi:NAD(P)-dependent oxidoreductase [Natronolimnobius sp. AArcel1]|uniref:NAD(P)-dependent oxidoreductase n=1 Tax=Natronolimnobius sp. AArcel1 TaxID=1679093 RepID=UPI0037427C30